MFWGQSHQDSNCGKSRGWELMEAPRAGPQLYAATGGGSYGTHPFIMLLFKGSIAINL
jgi:hypothetical protein